MTIACIGRATFDLGYACPSFPLEDGKYSASSFWSGAGGSALNGAVTARALGSDVRLLTLIGGGCFAVAVRAELASFDVPFEDFADPASEVLPVSSIIVVRGAGTRTIIDQQPPQEVVREARIEDALYGVSVLYCDGFLPEIAVPLAKVAREQGIPVVLDGGSWKPWTSSLIKHVDHAIVSERFHPPQISGGHDKTDILDAIHALGPSVAAITRGPGPIAWSDGTTRGEFAPPQEGTSEIVDTLGAGDIFHGAYCHFLASGSQVRPSLQRAAIVATESCRHYGTRAWISRSAS